MHLALECWVTWHILEACTTDTTQTLVLPTASCCHVFLFSEICSFHSWIFCQKQEKGNDFLRKLSDGVRENFPFRLLPVGSEHLNYHRERLTPSCSDVLRCEVMDQQKWWHCRNTSSSISLGLRPSQHLPPFILHPFMQTNKQILQ